MNLEVYTDRQAMGRAAAEKIAIVLRGAIARTGMAYAIFATGSSQFEVIEHLIAQPEIDWSKVTGFHLDEYIGLDENHPASFRKYLRERLVQRVPGGFNAFHYVNGDADDPAAECRRLTQLISGVTIDVACIGIGENGHIAFNDPPADVETTDAYLVVELDDACRKQQMGEGWFETLDDVPTRAITMSVREILRAHAIVCSVPDDRKATAVKNTVEGPVTPDVPGSFLKTHRNCDLLVDQAAASELATPPGITEPPAS